MKQSWRPLAVFKSVGPMEALLVIAMLTVETGVGTDQALGRMMVGDDIDGTLQQQSGDAAGKRLMSWVAW